MRANPRKESIVPSSHRTVAGRSSRARPGYASWRTTGPPRSTGPPQHRHAEQDDGFQVVPGTARFTVGDAVHDDAPAGTLVIVPPGVPHTFANPGHQPVVMVNIFTTDLCAQYFRNLRDVVADGRTAVAQAAGAVMGRYATTPGGHRPPVGPTGAARCRPYRVPTSAASVLPVTARDYPYVGCCGQPAGESSQSSWRP